MSYIKRLQIFFIHSTLLSSHKYTFYTMKDFNIQIKMFDQLEFIKENNVQQGI